uniref:Phosphoglycolate phosphatase n=1 Tax=Candidatus Methanogaster sp. ANME-2c ERB4 TaxID=2759911 RepID=A0A7G9YDM8_9EURY|nr:phosphoglycolate phosphatase [Methanosarcinales archaeon ANME-2c ERB4]
MAGNKIKAIVCDYDRTLTDESLILSEAAAASLMSARIHGIKVFIASGRRLPFLVGVNEGRGFADCIIAENGAVIYDPVDGTKTLLGEGLDELKAAFAGVDFVAIEEVIVATTIEHLEAVEAIVIGNGLSVDIELNRNDVMVMPKGVNKGSGIVKAAEMYGIERENLACVGDAENDLGMFAVAGVRVAVANAVDALKSEADIVCNEPYGAGVAEFVRSCLRGVVAQD